MADFTVVFTYGASSAVTVTAPANATLDEIIDLADQKDEAHLCHECGSHLTLGDPEPGIVEDEDGKVVWEDPTEGQIEADRTELARLRDVVQRAAHLLQAARPDLLVASNQALQVLIDAPTEG